MVEVDASDVTPPEVATTPEVGPNSTVEPPEVVPTEKLATKKPRKPRPPKVVTKLAAVSENSTPGPSIDVANVELRPSKEPPLPLEFWTGLMQTQKVVMAQRKSERYNSFRIT